MKKRIIRLVFLALIVAAGSYGVYRYAGNGTEKTADILKIYGTIDIRDASLAFNEQERIAEVLVEEGARVKAGQVLARLKTDRLKAAIVETQARIAAQQAVVKRLKAGNRPQEIAQARAEVEAAQARADNAARVLARLEQTSGSGATSQQDLDDARSRLMVERAQLKVRDKILNLLREGPRQEDIAAAEHNLAALQANRSLLSIRLDDMTLTAPTDGIIQNRILEPGEMAGPSRPVFTLALNDPKWVRAYVPEPYLSRINLGMPARILSDSFPGHPFKPKICAPNCCMKRGSLSLTPRIDGVWECRSPSLLIIIKEQGAQVLPCRHPPGLLRKAEVNHCHERRNTEAKW